MGRLDRAMHSTSMAASPLSGPDSKARAVHPGRYPISRMSGESARGPIYFGGRPGWWHPGMAAHSVDRIPPMQTPPQLLLMGWSRFLLSGNRQPITRGGV